MDRRIRIYCRQEIAALTDQRPHQIQRFRMIWFFIQNLAIDFLRLRQLAGAMMLPPLFHRVVAVHKLFSNSVCPANPRRHVSRNRRCIQFQRPIPLRLYL